MSKLKIEVVQWTHDCADGCCTDYGIDVFINGEEVSSRTEDITQILSNVLEHLKIDAEIKYTYEDDDALEQRIKQN
jgi:hypothetical protein